MSKDTNHRLTAVIDMLQASAGSASESNGINEAIRLLQEIVSDIALGTPDLERVLGRATEMGMNPTAIDGFADMDVETLMLQAALWHSMAIAHQNRSLNVELRSGEAIISLFDLCRERGIEIPDSIVDEISEIGKMPAPGR